MLDFTKNIKLEGSYLQQYRRAQAVVFVLFLLFAGLVAWNTLFPTQTFDFFFRTAGALKNTVILPRTQQGNLITDGSVTATDGLQFDAPLTGNYSEAHVIITLEKGSSPIMDNNLIAHKSYQAYFYPESQPLEPKNAQLFKIDDEYYELKDQQLFRFVSEKAFLTNFKPEQAIEKSVDFLQEFPLSEELIGFADGTLISTKESAFVISGNFVLPIADVETFESMNYVWGDILPVSGEEKGIYKRAKLFTLSSPHPNGTIFLEKDTGKYFYIQNGAKRPLNSPEPLASYLRNSPIAVENKSLSTESQCVLAKKTLSARSYTCTIDLGAIKDNLGNDYQFTFHAATDINVQEIHVQFKRELSVNNFKLALSELKKRLLQNYGTQ